MTPKGTPLPMLGGNPLANHAGTAEDDSVFFIPSFGVVLPGETQTLGFGFYAVNGMGVDYDISRTTVGAMQGVDSMTEYGVGKLAAALARDVGNGWVLGIQGSVNIARFRSNILTNQFMGPAKGDDWDTQFGAGFQLGVTKDVSWGTVGASYISRQWMNSFEDYDDLFFESLDLPPMAQAGIAWDVEEAVTLLVDGKWIGWSSVDQIGASPDEGGFGWEDQWMLKLGVIYELNETWKVRAGYSKGNSPITEDKVFANALFPAITEDHITLGVETALTDHVHLHFTFMHALENTLTQSASGSMASSAGAGTEISLEEQSYGIQLSYTF